MGQSIEQYCRETLRVLPPDGIDAALEAVAPDVDRLVHRPGGDPTSAPSLEWAFAEAANSAWPLEPGFVPFMTVDQASFACFVATPEGEPTHPLHGQVVRWHLTTGKAEHQRDLIDRSVGEYVASVDEELRGRPLGLKRMLDEIGPVYEANYLSRDKRPRDFVIRPVRLACQNVIVGLAAFGQDASIDGLSVYAWQTCEVPHVATHDGNRAMAALMLCDAFKNGGTMEIRFDQHGKLPAAQIVGKGPLGPFDYVGHPEGGRVPASLRRYARTVGVSVGLEDPNAISPTEARELFLAVTPMPAELESRVQDAIERGVATPERLCFTLMSSDSWKEIELDFILAVSDRAKSILEGGSPWQRRPDRQAETQIARSARMLGMLYRRLDALDAAAADTDARVLEDNRLGIEWSVLEDYGAVLFNGVAVGQLPWQSESGHVDEGDSLVVVPRSIPMQSDVDLVRSLQTDGVVPVLVVPGDAYDHATDSVDGLDTSDVIVLACPERIGELDQAIEKIMLTARITRR